MKHQPIADRLMDSCRETIEQTGECSNMAAFIDAESTHLGSVMYRCDEASRLQQAIAFAVFGHMIGATEAIVVMDAWMAQIKPGEETGVAVHDMPNRVEALILAHVGPGDPECFTTAYHRERGRIRWDETERADQFDGSMLKSWEYGLTTDLSSLFSLIDVMTALSEYGPFGFASHHPSTTQLVKEASIHLHGVDIHVSEVPDA